MAMDYPENPNLMNPNCMHLADGDPFSLDFELSEYLMLDGGVDHDSTSQSLASSEKACNMGGSSTGQEIITCK